MPFTLTANVVLTGLFAALADKGADHVADRYLAGGLVDNLNGTCRYVQPGTSDKPDCIVGNIGAQYGFLDLLHDSEGSGIAMLFSALEDAGVTVEPIARRMLIQAQSEQDARKTWGQAVQRAVEVYTNYLSSERDQARYELKQQKTVNQNLTLDLTEYKERVYKARAALI